MLACTGAGMQRTTSQLARRTLACHAAVLIEDGAGWLESEGGGRYRVEAPALFHLFPGDAHSYGPDAGTHWHEQWVLFEGSMVAGFRAGGLLDPAHPVLRVGPGSSLTALFARLRDELAGDGSLAGTAAAATLHRLLVEARLDADRIETDRTPAPAESLAEAIRSVAMTEIDFVALAARFGISPATLRRRLIAAYGVSPKAYQLRLRFDRAKELLALGDLSVEAVAAEVGFDDAYYFSRLFRQREGMPPSRFRAANRRT